MPQSVKKGFSVTILTTIFTSIFVALFGWFGTTVLDAHDTKIDVGYVKGQMETLNQSMVEFVSITHDNRIAIAEHELRLELCEEEVDLCKKKKYNDK